MDLIGVKARVLTATPAPLKKKIYSYGAILEIDAHNVCIIFTHDDVEWISKENVEYLLPTGEWSKFDL